jgi:hypothetical protein
MSVKSKTCKVGDSFTLSAIISPSNTTDKTITWTCDKSSIATVTNGTVTGIGPGSAIIKATASNGLYDYCIVTVGSATTTAPDSRFIGTWTLFEHGEYLSSISEYKWSRYVSRTFTNTNKYSYYASYEDYGVTSSGSPYMFDYEWKIESGQFKERLWDNEYDDWDSSSFTFTDSTHLTISYYLSGTLITEYYTKG